MNKKLLFVGTFIAMAALLGATAAAGPMDAYALYGGSDAFNFQGNFQWEDNFNNQQEDSSFNCQALFQACSP